jgi:hypothetical protein
MTSGPDDSTLLAERMLAAGAKVREVEQALEDRGVDRAAASRLVEEVLQAKLARASDARPNHEIRWYRIALGLAAAAIGFCVAYLGARNAPFLLPHPGVWSWAKCGGLVGGGAGLAIGALNAVRSDLMALLR